MRVALDQSGWPSSDPEVFIDLTEDNLNPDGAIIDRSGNLWSAQWGASRVAHMIETAALRNSSLMQSRLVVPLWVVKI